MTSATKCEFCDKRGLPLLLVRDAVAPSKSGAPLAPSLPIELASSAAHYTKRLIRSGYVNVFDEARKRWETYFVTTDNYFFKLLQTPGVIPAPPTKPFNCPDEGHRAIASCLTISDPVNATKVWIGFSDVLWTDAVRKKNEDLAYRRRHMQEVDIKAVLKGSYLPHRPIKQLDALIAEYAMEPRLAKLARDWSPIKFISRHGYADRLERECEALRPGSALIVTLSDPVGIAQELAFLMKRNAELFTEKNTENKRNLAASTSIDQIEEAIRKQAQDTEFSEAEKMANQQIQENPLGHWMSPSTRALTERLRNVTPAEVKRAEDDAWAKYSSKFDNVARQNWITTYGKRLQAFDAEFIAPLALNHVDWMKSTMLAHHLECNYDPLDAESGAVYTAAITQCITATQDKRACTELYNEWLQGDINDTKNFLLRAMILNQKITADAIKKAATVIIDARQIPWDTLFAASNIAMSRLNRQARDVTAHLIAQIGGSIAGMFHKVMDGSSGFRAAIMATGLISGHPVIICEIEGTKPKFVRLLTTQLIQHSGQSASEEKLKRAVAAELKRQQIFGEPVNGTTKRKWAMIVDKEMIRTLPHGLSPQEQNDLLVKTIKTPEALESLNLGRWRKVINTEVRAGIVMAVLQTICLTKLISDEQKSMRNENFDASARLYAGMASIAATTSEVIGTALAERAALGLRFGQGLVSAIGEFLKRTGRYVGLGAAFFVAGLDIYKGFSEYREGADGLVTSSYFVSGAVGLALTAALLASASIPVIVFLILLAIGIGLLIENVKDNPIQDWLERCPWGKLKEQRYADADIEKAQLTAALSEG